MRPSQPTNSWVKESDWPEEGARYHFPTYVTDGPFLHRLKDGTLVMLWSSLGAKGYAIGVSRSETGHILGPWHHEGINNASENKEAAALFINFFVTTPTAGAVLQTNRGVPSSPVVRQGTAVGASRTDAEVYRQPRAFISSPSWIKYAHN